MSSFLRRLQIRDVATVLGGVVVGAILAWMLVTQQQQRAQLDDDRAQLHGLSTGLDAQRRQAQAAGQTPVAKPPSAIRANPAAPTVSPAPPATTRPSDAQLYPAVVAAIRAHPEWVTDGISPAVLGAYVTNWLAKHPPKRGPAGPAPTADQLAAAVLDYYTAHPPAAGPSGPPGPTGPAGSDGKDGADGQPGAGATPEEIAAAVDQYFDDHPLPTCPAGTEAQAHQVVVDDDGNPLTTDTVGAVICVKT